MSKKKIKIKLDNNPHNHSPQNLKKGDLFKISSIGPDGTLELEEVIRRTNQVRIGPKWGPKPPK